MVGEQHTLHLEASHSYKLALECNLVLIVYMLPMR
jgi:hypothetical protein